MPASHDFLCRTCGKKTVPVRFAVSRSPQITSCDCGQAYAVARCCQCDQVTNIRISRDAKAPSSLACRPRCELREAPSRNTIKSPEPDLQSLTNRLGKLESLVAEVNVAITQVHLLVRSLKTVSDDANATYLLVRDELAPIANDYNEYIKEKAIDPLVVLVRGDGKHQHKSAEEILKFFFNRLLDRINKRFQDSMIAMLGGQKSAEELEVIWHSVPDGVEREIGKLEDRLLEALKQPLPEKRTASSRSGLSLRLDDMKYVLETFESRRALKLIKDLPEVFNVIDRRLRHKEREMADSGGTDTQKEAVEILRDLQASVEAWQKVNHIERIPLQEGEEYNYVYHFVVDRKDTPDKALDGHIASTRNYGYVYEGDDQEVVLQKAQVVVWEYTLD